MTEYRAVTLPAHNAALVAHDVQTVATVPHDPKIDGPFALLIHAGSKPPALGAEVGMWVVEHGVIGTRELWHLRRRSSRDLIADDGREAVPVHLGAVVAVARAEAVPIVSHSARSPRDEPQPPCLDVGLPGRPLHYWHHDAGWTDLSDQLPFADFTPGRTALLLSDVRRLDPPVREYPCCPRGCVAGGTVHECSAPVALPVRGRSGLWRPDSALITTCNPKETP